MPIAWVVAFIAYIRYTSSLLFCSFACSPLFFLLYSRIWMARKAQKRPRKAQGGPGRPREAQGSSERPRETQRDPVRPKELHRSPGENQSKQWLLSWRRGRRRRRMRRFGNVSVVCVIVWLCVLIVSFSGCCLIVGSLRNVSVCFL